MHISDATLVHTMVHIDVKSLSFYTLLGLWYCSKKKKKRHKNTTVLLFIPLFQTWFIYNDKGERQGLKPMKHPPFLSYAFSSFYGILTAKVGKKHPFESTPQRD